MNIIIWSGEATLIPVLTASIVLFLVLPCMCLLHRFIIILFINKTKKVSCCKEYFSKWYFVCLLLLLLFYRCSEQERSKEVIV
jgi:hypothetical protein